METSYPTSGDITAQMHGAVLVITFNRPEAMNTFTVASEGLYGDLLEQADHDPQVRVVVVGATGRAWCAGADFADLARLAAEPDGLAVSPYPRRRDFPLALRKPLIAAVDGAAAGLGMVHALYADIRFAGPNAAFLTAFAQRGLAAEYGISWLLPRVVGHSRALDLMLSSRKVKAAEAARIGLVDHLVEDGDVLQAAVEYATAMATSCSPSSMAAIKKQIFDDHERPFTESYDVADALMHERLDTPDFAEGVASFTERRAPSFPPLS